MAGKITFGAVLSGGALTGEAGDRASKADSAATRAAVALLAFSGVADSASAAALASEDMAADSDDGALAASTGISGGAGVATRDVALVRGFTIPGSGRGASSSLRRTRFLLLRVESDARRQ